ncbi:MAG: hypothetical protein NC183_06970 [Corallococcus sp.]|nr:hypothetical protein [Corallococcus sp.]
MLTRKEVEERNLTEGKDFVYMGRVRYQVGDSFFRGDKKIGIKQIIDPVHFLSDDYSCWHTYMFHDFKCRHGKNMIPLEYNGIYYDDAEERLQTKQVFTTDVFVLNKNKKIEHKGNCIIRFSPESNDYILEIGENETYKSNALCGVLSEAFGEQSNEMLYVLQDWGVSGEMPQEVLLDDNCKKIKYEGFDHTLICSGKMENTNDTVTLLKRHCEPAQQFVLVRYLKPLESGEYIGDNVWEDTNFNDAANTFNEYTGRSVEWALKHESEAEL